MADRFTSPLFELFASLGLDSSGLSEGLGNAEVDIRKFQGVINAFVNDYRTAMGRMDAATEGAQIALTQLLDTNSRNITAVGEGIDKLVARQERFQAQSERMKEQYIAAQAAMREAEALWQTGLHPAMEGKRLVSLGNEDIVQQLAARAQLQRSMIEERSLRDQSDLALKESAATRLGIISEQEAADLEYAQLKAKLSAESIAAIEAETAAQEELMDRWIAADEAMTEADIERQAVREATAAASQKATAAETASGGFASVGVRMGAGGIYPTIRAGMSGLGEAIAPLFPVLMAGAFVDILYHEIEAVAKLTDEWTGFGKEAKKAWEEAFSGAERTRIKTSELIAEWEKARATAAKGAPLTRSEETTIDRHHATNLTQDINAATAQLAILDKELAARQRESAATPAGAANQFLRWASGGKDLETVKKEREETEASIRAMTEERGKIERRILEDVDKKHKLEDSKMHDRIHQYPERMPWFMGTNPAEVMLQTMGFGPQPTRSVITGHMPTPPPSSSMNSSRVSPQYEGGATARTATTAGGGINITNTYAPVFKFDGVPADIVKFMREEAEPMLIADMQKNARGVMTQIMDTLKKNGVRVNG